MSEQRGYPISQNRPQELFFSDFHVGRPALRKDERYRAMRHVPQKPPYTHIGPVAPRMLSHHYLIPISRNRQKQDILRCFGDRDSAAVQTDSLLQTVLHDRQRDSWQRFPRHDGFGCVLLSNAILFVSETTPGG